MAENGDIKAQEATYSGMIAMLKWGAVACFIIAFGVIFLIAS
jgi:hypothetical protein